MTTQNPYGTDLWVSIGSDGTIDVDPTMREVSGVYVLAQSLVIRQLNSLGAFLGYPDEGINIRSWLSKGFTQAQIQQLGAQVQAQLQRDQRVTSAVVSASFVFATGTLTLVENVQCGAGPFTLTLGISRVSTSVLFNGVPLGSSG